MQCNLNTTAKWRRDTCGRLQRLSNVFLHDVVSLVSHFLSPRDLFNTLFTSKIIMSAIQLDDIIRNALSNGNVNMKTTLENLYDLTLYGKIYLPSCERLTRLINARRCELCNVNRIKAVRQGYGIAICFPCLLGNTNGNVYTSELLSEPPCDRKNTIGTHEIVSNHRVSTVSQGYYISLHGGTNRYFTSSKSQCYPYGERRFIWNHPIVNEHGTRKEIGPIVTKKDVAMLQKMSTIDELETYITVHLKAPALTVYRDFNDAVRHCRQISYTNAQKQKRLNAVKKSAAARARQLKLTKVQEWIAVLAQKLPSSARYLLEFMINYQYTSHGPKYCMLPLSFLNAVVYSRLNIVFFYDDEIHALLKTYISAPSRLNPSKMEIARAGISNIYLGRGGGVSDESDTDDTFVDDDMHVDAVEEEDEEEQDDESD